MFLITVYNSFIVVNLSCQEHENVYKVEVKIILFPAFHSKLLFLQPLKCVIYASFTLSEIF